MKPKRSSRKTKLAKLDTTSPITLDMIGTYNDPCFGKLYDGKASECRRCGDSEVCLIAMGQNNHKNRDSIEAIQQFKDLKPEEFSVSLTQVARFLEAKLDEEKYSGGIKFSLACKLILKYVLPKEYTLDDSKNAVNKVVKDLSAFRFKKINDKKHIIHGK